MAKLSNLIIMIELLKTGRKYSIKELGERLEVSERTIREYKLFLEEAGIYVDTIRGPYGGYILRQDINLPRITFTESDMEVLKKSITFIKNEETKENIINLTNKINANILSEENI